MKNYVGIDIGGTRIKFGIVNEKGNIIHHDIINTPQDYEDMMKVIETFLEENNKYDIQGIGLSTPGIVTSDGYMQTSGAIKCFLHHHIKEELTQRFLLPVSVENDAKCAAAGEKWLGAAKDVENFVCLTLGTAVGGAIYINNQLVRGLGGLAGEFGIVLAGLEKNVYNEQSYSYHAATVAGLCRNYSYSVHERVLDAQEIYRRKDAGDTIAAQCIEDFYHACATLFVNIAAILAPEVIFIGGGISNNEEAMTNMKKEYDRMCQEYHVLSLVEVPKLMTCTCKNDAGLLGAVYTFIQQTC